MIGRSVGSDASPLSCFFFVLGKAAKAQETQSYQRFQHIGHTAFNTSGTNGPRSLFRMKAGTHSPSPAGAHTAAHRAKRGVFQMGALSLPSSRFARFGNSARPGVRTANFAAFGSWSRGISKSTESLRNSDALMRVAVPRRRGPAGSRCSTAVSCAAPVSFAVRYHCDEGQREKFVNVTVVILFVV